MFHTYVLARSGRSVDIDRATFLMDQQLFQQSLDALEGGRRESSLKKPSSAAQEVWDFYCTMHRAKYGTDFVPDVDGEWDQ